MQHHLKVELVHKTCIFTYYCLVINSLLKKFITRNSQNDITSVLHEQRLELLSVCTLTIKLTGVSPLTAHKLGAHTSVRLSRNFSDINKDNMCTTDSTTDVQITKSIWD